MANAFMVSELLSGEGKYPFGFQYCTHHFCDLVFYLVPDCGKSISEEGYYLMDMG